MASRPAPNTEAVGSSNTVNSQSVDSMVGYVLLLDNTLSYSTSHDNKTHCLVPLDNSIVDNWPEL